MVDFIIVLAVIMIIFLVLFIYTNVINPRRKTMDEYTNPKNKRPVSEIQTPDLRGKIVKWIKEEGVLSAGSGLWTIKVEAKGNHYYIPHVNPDRDCKAFNIVQAFAGTDAPMLVCCVDQNGLRHPEYLDAMTTPGISPIGERDAERRAEQLSVDFAQLKEDYRKVSHNEEFMDKVKKYSKGYSELRKDMWITSDNDENYGSDNDEKKP